MKNSYLKFYLDIPEEVLTLDQVFQTLDQVLSLDQLTSTFSSPDAFFPSREKFDEILSVGKVAITFGDIVDTKEDDVGILSGDTLLLKLAEVYKPSITFFVMDFPGVVKGNLDAEVIEIYKKISSKFVNKVQVEMVKTHLEQTYNLSTFKDSVHQ